MLWDPYVAEKVTREKRRDLLREAERDRLVQQALAQGAKNPGLYCRLLAGLRRRMVLWGQQLQGQYGLARASRLSVTDQGDGEEAR